MNQVKNYFTSVLVILVYFYLLLEIAFSLFVFAAIPLVMGFGLLMFIVQLFR